MKKHLHKNTAVKPKIIYNLNKLFIALDFWKYFAFKQTMHSCPVFFNFIWKSDLFVLCVCLISRLLSNIEDFFSFSEFERGLGSSGYYRSNLSDGHKPFVLGKALFIFQVVFKAFYSLLGQSIESCP